MDSNKRPLVGAIRWDAWGGEVDYPNAPGSQTQRTLSASKYHHRLPWYAEVTGSDSVKIPLYTQELIDQEIKYSCEAGLDYWAFVMYEPGGNSLARDLYLQSEIKNGIKWAALIGASAYSFDYYPWMVSQFKEPNYQKTEDGRPIVFERVEDAYDDMENYLKIASTLREEAKKQGVKEPYLVVMDASSKEIAKEFKPDAISSYSAPGVDGQPFTDMTANSIKLWDKWLGWCDQVVPMVTSGWDPNPRLDSPVTWYQGYGKNEWAQEGTAQEIAEHIAESIEWNNKQKNPSDILLIYAWNENDEGGWLMPTWTSEGKPDTSRIDAVRAVLKK